MGGDSDGLLTQLLKVKLWLPPETSERHRCLLQCGVRSVHTFRRCVGTPVASDATNDGSATAAHYRGAPCVLNVLLVECGCPWFPTETLEDIMRATGGLEHFKSDIRVLLRDFCDWYHSYNTQELGSAIGGHQLTPAGVLATLQRCGVKHAMHVQRLACQQTDASGDDLRSRLQTKLANDAAADANPSSSAVWTTTNIAAAHILRDLGRVEVEEGVGCAAVFSAPHGIFLHRDHHAVHVPEEHTTSLARTFAGATGGTCIVWADSERCKSEFLKRADLTNRDPNFLLGSELKGSPWHLALVRHAHRFNVPPLQGGGMGVSCLHVDLHGRRDVIPGPQEGGGGRSDCDIGTASLQHMRPTDGPELGGRLNDAIAAGLRALFREWWQNGVDELLTVDQAPKMNGYKGGGEGPSSGRVTMSMQGVELGLVSVQLELSRRLRKALIADAVRQHRFAHVLVDAFGKCCVL